MDDHVTLGTRIRIALGVTGLAPVLLLGWLAGDGARRELAASVGGALSRQAGEVARGCERFTLDRLQGLRQTASFIPFDHLTRAEASAALAIPYRQATDLQVLAVLDAGGHPVTDVVFERHPELDPTLAGHEPVDERGLEAFALAVPLRAALESGLAVGPPYRSPSSGVPRLALAVRLGAGDRALAAELSLAELASRLQEAAGGGEAFLIDGAGRVLAGTSATAPGPEEARLAAEETAGGGPPVRLVRRADGTSWLAAAAPVGSLGWSVLLAQPADAAFRTVGHLRRQTLVWAVAALALAGALGLVLSRALTRPVGRLTEAAAALRDGHLDAPLPPTGPDELGALSGTFAHMAAEVRRRDAEIRAFNAELQERVDTRTAELRAAEEQIARSRRLASLGSLSAGVADGLNDPLTAVVGLVTVARAEVGPDTPQGQLLGTALEEARRATAVIHDLRRLAAPGLAEGARRFALGLPVAGAVERIRPAAASAGVTVQVDLGRDLPDMEGDPAQVEALVLRLLENAVAATPPGGLVMVATSGVEGAALRLVVADTGRGIPAALRDRIFDPFFTAGRSPGAGLGLSLAHGIVEAHHGRIQVESEEGRGSIFTVHFPATAAPTHPA
jgi:signal transduction histidine kinase